MKKRQHEYYNLLSKQFMCCNSFVRNAFFIVLIAKQIFHWLLKCLCARRQFFFSAQNCIGTKNQILLYSLVFIRAMRFLLHKKWRLSGTKGLEDYDIQVLRMQTQNLSDIFLFFHGNNFNMKVDPITASFASI